MPTQVTYTAAAASAAATSERANADAPKTARRQETCTALETAVYAAAASSNAEVAALRPIATSTPAHETNAAAAA